MSPDPTLTWLPLAAVGAVAGILSGFFGIGGGWVAVPALHLLGLTAPEAVGTSMAFLCGTGVMGAARHARSGNVRAVLAAWLAAPLLIGVEGGRRLMTLMAAAGHADGVLRFLFITMLGGMGVAILLHAARGRPAGTTGVVWAAIRRWPPRLHPRWADGPVSLWIVIAGGLLTGLLAGMMGLGGGFLLVPLLMYGTGVPPVVAVGTSLLCVTAVGAVGAAGYATDGHVDWIRAGILLAGSLAGVPLGVRACGTASPESLRGLYGVMLLLAAVSMTAAAAGRETAARWVLFASAGGLALTVVALPLLRRRREAAGDGH